MMNNFDNFRVIDGAIYEGQSLIPEPVFTLFLQYWDGRGIEVEAIRVPKTIRHKGTVFTLKNAESRIYKELDIVDLELIKTDNILAEYRETLKKAQRDAILSQLDELDAYTWQERCRAWRNHETVGESVYQVYMAVQGLSKISVEALAEHVKKVPPMFLKQTENKSQRWDLIDPLKNDTSPPDRFISEYEAPTPNPNAPAIDYLAEESTPAMLNIKFSKVIRETRTIHLHDPKPEN